MKDGVRESETCASSSCFPPPASGSQGFVSPRTGGVEGSRERTSHAVLDILISILKLSVFYLNSNLGNPRWRGEKDGESSSFLNSVRLLGTTVLAILPTKIAFPLPVTT